MREDQREDVRAGERRRSGCRIDGYLTFNGGVGERCAYPDLRLLHMLNGVLSSGFKVPGYISNLEL